MESVPKITGACQVNSGKLKDPLPGPNSVNVRRPRGRGVGVEMPKDGSTDEMTLAMEGVVNRSVCGEKPLG